MEKGVQKEEKTEEKKEKVSTVKDENVEKITKGKERK